MNANDILNKGGWGTAIVYCVVVALTLWFKVAPEIPEPHFWGFIAAGGVVVTGILSFLGIRKSPPKPAEPATDQGASRTPNDAG